MDSPKILPLNESLSFIQALTSATWPLTTEQVRNVAVQVGWKLETTKEYSWYQSFEIAPNISGTMTCHSYGVPDLAFRVSEVMRGEVAEEKRDLVNAHMMTLEKELTVLYGQPFRFTNEDSRDEYRWWTLPSGVWLRINYGHLPPRVALTGPRHEQEPEDLIIIPPTQDCLRSIQTWLDAPWPLPVSAVHDYADRLGWNAEEESSSTFFSTFQYVLYKENPYSYSEDFFAEPDIDVSYGPRGAKKINFPLAEHWSMRTEAEAWPLIQARMGEVEAALSELYGTPEKGPIGGDRCYAKWAVTEQLSMSLIQGPGTAFVRIEHLAPQEEGPGIPFNYEVDEVVSIIDEWTQSMGSIDLFDAAEIADGIGWFPVDQNWPDIYYTQVSPQAEPRAAIRDENQQVWLVTFDVAMGVKEGTPGRSPADIERVMKNLETVLTQRYGSAEEATHFGCHYRDWDTRKGVRVRIAYGSGMSSVWIYDPAKKATVEGYITQTAPSTTLKNQPASKESAGTDAPAGGSPYMSKLAFFGTFLAVLGMILKYLFF